MSLVAQQLACTRGGRELFRLPALHVAAGDALRIAGDNGAGKTSLLRILCGLSSPAHGSLTWQGQEVGRIREQFCRALTYIGHPGAIKDDLSACENVLLAQRLCGNPVTRAQVYAALDQSGLDAVADLPTRVLSQGQKKRVSLTRLQLCSAGLLWILDEPFAALDQSAQLQLTGVLNRHLEKGGMLVYSTHQEMILQAGNNLTLTLGAAC